MREIHSLCVEMTHSLPAFTSESASVARKQGARRRPAHALRQLCDMQDVLFSDATNIELTAKDRAACACAWDKLEERKRILRGKPLPGSHKPESPKAKRRVASVVEPTEMP
jgi:hypothetical protein